MTAKFTRRNYGRGHSYYLDGGKIPGVTTILSDGLAKPALVNWAARTVAGYAVDHWDGLGEMAVSERLEVLKGAHWADRDAAGKRGTEVHALADKLAKGEEVAVPDELAGHVDAYVKFLNDFEPHPVLTETSVVSMTKWPYAGTLDMVADFPGLGQRLLCDIKTARSGVFPDNGLQLAAYRYATHHLAHGGQLAEMPPVDGCAVIHVRSDGYSLVPVRAGPPEHRVFLYCRELWRWAHDTSKTVVGEELSPAQGAPQ
jgi:hypothetical protein